MNKAIRRYSIIVFTAVLFLLSLFISGCQSRYEDLDLSAYQYRDTKNLVKFVYNAALILKKDGVKSLQYFQSNRGLYCTPDRYLYIYDMKGVNIYHAGMPDLEGKNLWNLTDKNGKKPIQMAISAVADQNNPHAWVHYSWWEPGKFYPVPKFSCHFKVRTPEGLEFFVGGGLNYPLEEKEFIRIIVDDAARRIKEEGASALPSISDPASRYNFRDVKVFVFTPTGHLLISPVMNDSITGLELLDSVDEMGHKPFRKALFELNGKYPAIPALKARQEGYNNKETPCRKAPPFRAESFNDGKNKDTVWVVFLAKNRYQRMLIKKALYLRKTFLAGEEIYVGAITDLPQPPG